MSRSDLLVYQYAVCLHCIRTTWTKTINDSKYGLYLHLNHFGIISFKMKDLLFFICFILIFLCGFSIASWALISTTSQIHWEYNYDGQLLNITVNHLVNNSWSWPLAKDVINYGIWKVFGQIDEIGIDRYSIVFILLQFRYLDGMDWYSNIVFILAIIFVTIANVLLLNVLIALFKYQSTKVSNIFFFFSF